MSFSPRWLPCAAVALLLSVGCEQAAPTRTDMKPTKPVTVTVTYNGTAVAGATVSFIPAEGSDAAFGLTDAQGVAKLKTYAEGDGAVLGAHKVTISKTESSGAAAADESSPEYDPNATGSEIKYLLPQKYMSPVDSGLTAEVTESGPNEFKFELTD